MTVIVLTAVVPGLRGQLTRWLMEVAPGTFVGRISRRVRERIWLHVEDKVGDGQAVMLFPARTEQGFQVWTAGRDRWRPADFDGLWLMVRPHVEPRPAPPASSPESDRQEMAARSREGPTGDGEREIVIPVRYY